MTRMGKLKLQPELAQIKESDVYFSLRNARTEQEVAEALYQVGIDLNIGKLLLIHRNRFGLIGEISEENSIGSKCLYRTIDLEPGIRRKIDEIEILIEDGVSATYPVSYISKDNSIEAIDLFSLLDDRNVLACIDAFIFNPIVILDREYYLILILDDNSVDFTKIEVISTIRIFFDYKLRRMCRNIFKQMNKLSPRERQVLHWTALGKTSFEISMILNLSEFTINNYIANITKKIGASNRSNAILVSILYRYI